MGSSSCTRDLAYSLVRQVEDLRVFGGFFASVQEMGLTNLWKSLTASLSLCECQS